MAQGQRISYRRVSTEAQSTERQLDGLEFDCEFEDRLSGKDTNRPQLQALLKYARSGDVVVVHSMCRLARNLTDLLALVQELTGKGVKVRFHKEGLEFSGDDSPLSMLMLSLMGAFSAFERAILLERQREGIHLAKQRGAYKGRKPALTSMQAEQLRIRANAGESKAKLARELGVSRETVYAYLRVAS